MIVFFVSDTQRIWTDSARKRYRTAQKTAMQTLLRAARKWDVDLQIRNAYVDVTLPMICMPDNYDVWSKNIISKYGTLDIPAYQRKHEAVKQCTEAPIIFVLNKPFRSRAVTVDWLTRMHGEMSLISSDYDVHTIMHELLHQFGAMDLYYPKKVSDLVKQMGYKSVMHIHSSTDIDSLTAYLVGWTDEIDTHAAIILDRTKHYTREDIAAFIREKYQKAT